MSTLQKTTADIILGVARAYEDPKVRFAALDMARQVYAAFGNSRGWAAPNGQPMPPFEELPVAVRETLGIGAVFTVTAMRNVNLIADHVQ